MPAAASYLFLEIAIVISVYLFTAETAAFRSLFTRRFAQRAAVLFVVWLIVDLVAVRLGLWFFPAGGTLPVRILDLPLEEYALFFLHSVVCQMLVTGSEADR
jgi:lycopene cyclase domain-containing protein